MTEIKSKQFNKHILGYKEFFKFGLQSIYRVSNEKVLKNIRNSSYIW